jgi:lipocalin
VFLEHYIISKETLTKPQSRNLDEYAFIENSRKQLLATKAGYKHEKNMSYNFLNSCSADNFNQFSPYSSSTAECTSNYPRKPNLCRTIPNDNYSGKWFWRHSA